MTRPARRGKSALSAVIGTVVNVVTLPFRVIGRLFGRRRTRAY
ncbi:LPFR motif small protein [Actinophytocola gossypii]|nr:LPFR motif small protein [Actinophytocola gossypii]